MRSIMSMKSVLKLNKKDTIRFLDLYQKEPVLYNPTLSEYRDCGMRAAAAKRVAAALNICGFGPREVMYKFKNLRCSYCQELKKITDSQRSGKSTDEVYQPRVVWFTKMNSFMRPFVQQRETRSNMVQQKNDAEVEINQGIKVEVVEYTAHNESSSHTPQLLGTPSLCNKFVEKRIQFSKKLESDNISSKNTKQINVCKETDIRSRVSCGLQDESSQVTLNAEKKEDSYDHFGRYIASLLRTIESSQALKLQQQIITLITNQICALVNQNQYNNIFVPNISCSEGEPSEYVSSPSGDKNIDDDDV